MSLMKNYLLLCWAGFAPLVFSACEPIKETAEQIASPQPVELMGRWHYDSVGFAYYTDNVRFDSSTEPISSGAILTIGERSWIYSGSLHEIHSYIRQENTVDVRRIGDPSLVQRGYISAEGVGQVLGGPNELDIVGLTSTRLVLSDSAQNATASGNFTVCKYYHSR